LHRRSSAEFPNDNPELHDGALWICRSVRGAPEPELVARKVAAAIVLRAVPRERAPLAKAVPRARIEAPPAAPAPPSAPFERFAQVLTQVALAAGGVRAAQRIPGVLGLEAPPLASDTGLEALRARGFWSEHGPSPRLLAMRDAFRAMLAGETADLSVCGSATLDTWSADLLTALLEWPAFRAEEVRRDLRRAGIAAFGLLARAA